MNTETNIAAAEGAAEVKTKPKRTAPRAKVNHELKTLVELVFARYTEKGWRAMIFFPRTAVNDLIAQKSAAAKTQKIHFIQVKTDELIAANPKAFEGEQKNAFIQNAFSNNATPVYAVIVPQRGGKINLQFESANDGSKIIL